MTATQTQKRRVNQECAAHRGWLAKLVELQRQSKRLRDGMNRSIAKGKHPDMKRLVREINDRAMIFSWMTTKDGCQICAAMKVDRIVSCGRGHHRVENVLKSEFMPA